MAKKDYVIRVLNSPMQVNADDWNALLALQSPVDAPSPFMRHEYLTAMLKSGSATPATGWTARFFTLSQGNELVAACVLYLKAHSYGEYVFDHAWANAYHQHGLAYYPKALVAPPFTPVPGPRLLARDAQSRTLLVQALVAWCSDEKLSSLHLLFASDADVAACEDAGLMLRHNVQFHWFNNAPTLVAARTALPPEGAGLAWGGPAQRPPGALQPLLVVFHGLEGSSKSHYSQAFADVASAHGWACCVPHFRGCSGELNHGPRAYHSGDFEEIDWILRRLQAGHNGPLVVVGVSLGGNALMRWAGEIGSGAAQVVRAIASVSSPLDLASSGWAIGRGFNRQVYSRMFLRSMVPKALEKLDQHPGLFNRADMHAVRDIYTFDNIFTAPLHGFKNTDDYYQRASGKPHMQAIAVPALALNTINDPFIPAWSLPKPPDVSPSVTLWQPTQGGHVGFPAGAYPAHVRAMPGAVVEFFAAHL